MKQYIFGIALLCSAAAAPIYAEVVENAGGIAATMQDKVAVRPEDLPEAVKSTLAGDAYSGWRVESAFLITKEDNSQFFEVNLQKGEESMKAFIDKYGKKID